MMRIVIDLQAAQTTGSRNRGIGRYSVALAQAMVRNRGDHEIIIALSGLFPETILPIRKAFAEALPPENIRVWHAAGPVSHLAGGKWERHAAQKAREAFLLGLRPDVVHVTSLFEGLVDDAVTSIGAFSTCLPTAVTLYDLIPYIHRSPYLDNPAVAAWYMEKLDALRRADLWLGISGSSCREGVEHLGLPVQRTINISTDADPHFKPEQLGPERERDLRQRYGLSKPFVMYTGGIDHRKNIEGLISAYAGLPAATREAYQLAIVCSIQPESRSALETFAAQAGLKKGVLVLTGFVPEEDLVALYNLCKLFVFPSWHEGFGLPALEAMRCGAPVVGANTSSLPEVIGWGAAMFDPRSVDDMRNLIHRGLTDQSFRDELIAHGARQAASFSWDKSAAVALDAFEQLRRENVTAATSVQLGRRPRLAYLSPLPPQRSGIADYSAELIPELARHYEIDLILAQDQVSDVGIASTFKIRSIDWFREHHARYDRVLYHFGNSEFHQHMFSLLDAIPGVVVLHDFFLSGILAHMELNNPGCNIWSQALYSSHGYAALNKKMNGMSAEDAIWEYPCSLDVIKRALGLIVHSNSSVELCKKWFGAMFEGGVCSIPLLRVPAQGVAENVFREEIGFKKNDFVVCSYGMISPTKMAKELIQAWLNSELSEKENCYLVFVGEQHPGDYGKEVEQFISRHKNGARIKVAGWVSAEEFRGYLSISDVAVQLRTLSRGETSAAVLDCMNHGTPTIVNANGSMADLPGQSVYKLPDEFSREDLTEAIEALWRDDARRKGLGEQGRKLIVEQHSPRLCADQYFETIERFYQADASMSKLAREIAISAPPVESVSIVQKMAIAVSRNYYASCGLKQLLIDVSEEQVRVDFSGSRAQKIKKLLISPPSGCRAEPIYVAADGVCRYARKYALALLGVDVGTLEDAVVEYECGDVIELSKNSQGVLKESGVLAEMLETNVETGSFSV